jgi:hypothetical protein
MHSFLPQVLYTVWCFPKSYGHTNNCKKNFWEKGKQKREREKKLKKKKATAQIGTNVKARVFNAGLLARSQFASGRSCDRLTRARFSVVFLGPRAIAVLVPKFHIALHASHGNIKKFALH